jgi:hypothetical protein
LRPGGPEGLSRGIRPHVIDHEQHSPSTQRVGQNTKSLADGARRSPLIAKKNQEVELGT